MFSKDYLSNTIQTTLKDRVFYIQVHNKNSNMLP